MLNISKKRSRNLDQLKASIEETSSDIHENQHTGGISSNELSDTDI